MYKAEIDKYAFFFKQKTMLSNRIRVVYLVTLTVKWQCTQTSNQCIILSQAVFKYFLNGCFIWNISKSYGIWQIRAEVSSSIWSMNLKGMNLWFFPTYKDMELIHEHIKCESCINWQYTNECKSRVPSALRKILAHYETLLIMENTMCQNTERICWICYTTKEVCVTFYFRKHSVTK